MAEGNLFPKISEGNWWKLRELFKKSIPGSVNPKYLAISLEMTELSARTNIMPALQQLGIIDDQGKPTERANHWRIDEKYPEVCAEIVSEIYPQELLDTCPGPNPDKQKVQKWFTTTRALGESAAQKLTSTFILLVSAEIKSDTGKSLKKKVTKNNSDRSKGKSKLDDVQEEIIEESEIEKKKPIPHSYKSPTVHVDLQIHISPESSPELVDKIFESIRKHLYFND